MDKTLTRADVILTLDDVAAGVACFGAPLQDEHGIAEVSPGVLADGSQPRDAGGRAARCGVRDARLRRGSVHRAAMVEFAALAGEAGVTIGELLRELQRRES